MGRLAEQRMTVVNTGKLEKQDPLPAGRYWIDVFGSNVEVFEGWLTTHESRVHVVKREHYDAQQDMGGGPLDFHPAGDWFLFVVDEPNTIADVAPWALADGTMLAPIIGWPNVAPDSVRSAADTIQSPKPEPGLFGGPGLGGDWEWPTWVPWAVGGGVVVVGLMVWSSIRD